MERKTNRYPRAHAGGQRIGPALRALRQREGLTHDELAGRCGMTAARISRIEQGRGDVSLQALMSLSSALNVDVNYFTSYQDAVLQTEQTLSEVLRTFEVCAGTIAAFLGLSFEAQGALLDGLRRVSSADSVIPLREQELVDQLLDHGVEASIVHILSAIPNFGLDMQGFCRVITQMEELPGDRMVMSDRLLTVTTPNGGQIEPLSVFRTVFQAEPENAAILRLWVQSLQSAVSQNLERHESRTVYSLASIQRYIDSGRWGAGLVVEPAVRLGHIHDLARALRTIPNFHVGFVRDEVPFNMLIKGGNQVLVQIRRDTAVPAHNGPGVAFRSTRPDVAGKFRDYFEALWDTVLPEHKDSAAVAGWLEEQVASIAR